MREAQVVSKTVQERRGRWEGKAGEGGEKEEGGREEKQEPEKQYWRLSR